MRMLIRRRYVRRVARMIVGVRSGMVLMLGLRRERLGRRRRCPRPVVRPVAFIGAIHLQGRISSTRPEESLPPSTHGDTKDSDIDMMATLVAGRIGDTFDLHACFYLHNRSVSSLRSSFLACRFVPKILPSDRLSSDRSVSLAVSSERYFCTSNSHVAMFAQTARRNGCVRMRHCTRRRENATKHMYARGRDSSFVRPRLVSCRVRTVSFHFHVLTFSAVFRRTFQQRRVLFKPPPSATQLTLVERRSFFLTFYSAIRVAIAFFRRSMTIRRPSRIGTNADGTIVGYSLRRAIGPLSSLVREFENQHTLFSRIHVATLLPCITVLPR